MKRFNLRVYGLIINENDEVLVADERRFNNSFTKFPGGGLEWGEGLKETLQREIKEELGLESAIGELFFVNDFAQISAFNENDQLFSFYYFVSSIKLNKIPISNYSFPLTEDGEKFRWIGIAAINSETFTFPLDKIVGEKLKKMYI